mmetsp:Transcript_11151/g.21226  ORF Transcript_11151/g.21226 Transcript_11151/m.21226 type:complete len:121 (+) Transcript_11151:183-545(+)|eukprot:scaffold202_cov180-Amphora_coffeaeformis.AAC.8
MSSSNIENLTVLSSPQGVKVVCSVEQPFELELQGSDSADTEDNSQSRSDSIHNLLDRRCSISESIKETPQANKDSYVFWNEVHHHHRVLSYVSDWKEAESSHYEGSWAAASKDEHEFWGI